MQWMHMVPIVTLVITVVNLFIKVIVNWHDFMHNITNVQNICKWFITKTDIFKS